MRREEKEQYGIERNGKGTARMECKGKRKEVKSKR